MPMEIIPSNLMGRCVARVTPPSGSQPSGARIAALIPWRHGRREVLLRRRLQPPAGRPRRRRRRRPRAGRHRPGGLVTALEPVMRAADGAWVGWAGAARPRARAVRQRRHPHRAGAAQRPTISRTTTRASATTPSGRCTTTSSRSPATTASGGTATSRSTSGSRMPRPRSPRRARPCGCRTTSCSSCRRCCARPAPTSRSGSSTTSRSRHTASTRSCRGAPRSSRGCSAPTSSGSSGSRTPATSPAPCGGCSATRRKSPCIEVPVERRRGPRAGVMAKAFPISIDVDVASRSSREPPTCRRGRARSARASATRRRSCSASTASTTRRASATG